MKGIFGVLLTIMLCPVMAQTPASGKAFRFSDGGTSTVYEIVRGDPAAVDTLVFTYGGSGCTDLARYWLPTLADGMAIPARFMALNKRHVASGQAQRGGSDSCSRAFRAWNLPRH